MEEVKEILNKLDTERDTIKQNLATGTGNTFASLKPELLDADRIYNIDQIREVCIDYRLRFLDSKYFKGKLPEEAISIIRALEKEHGIALKSFKIAAPSKLFKLENADDPLLFVPISDRHFYLIHKWGRDLHPLRKWLVLPFRNLLYLIVLVLAVSWVATKMIPISWFTKEYHPSMFWILYLFMFKMIGTIVLFYGFALGKNFNPAIWNSKYFNA